MPILGGCLCCDLKVGSTVLGVIHLILGLTSTLGLLVALLFMSILATGAEAVQQDFKKQLEALGDSLDYQDRSELDNADDMMKIIREHSEKALIVIYIFLALAVLKVITTSMLIHGVRRDRRGLLLPFVFQETLNVLCVIGLLITLFVLLGANKVTGAAAAIVIVSLSVGIYCILIVISQYQALGLIRMHEEIDMK